MRLLIIGSSPASGLLYHPTRMALELRKHGVEVHVATWGAKEQSPGLSAQLKMAGVPLHRINCLQHHGWHALVGSNRDISDCVRAVAPDVIHVFGAVTSYQVRNGHSGSRSPRVVAMIASMGSGSKHVFPARLGAILLNRYADVVVAQCQAERARLLKAGVSPDRLCLIPTPLDCDDFLAKAAATDRAAILARYSVPHDGKLLGCFANLKPAKRQDLLIRAFASVHVEFPDWRLVLAGEGVWRQFLEQLAAESGLRERVHFVGRVPNEEVAPMQAAMDAVAHCSVAETFGYNAVEPLLLAKPTVITRVGFAHEIEQAGRAVVIAPDNLEELRHGLRHVMSPDEATLAMANSAPEFVRCNIDVGVVMDRLIKVYRG
jgi:glycosyltransferase involved in cell wall biosynthesis